MIITLSDEETTALARLLRDTIDSDRFPLSPPHPSFESRTREDPTGAHSRALAAAEGVCAAAS
jgi:hypothetical protein